MPKKKSKRDRALEYLEETRPAVITEREWEELQNKLAPISASYLRSLLRSMPVPLTPLVGGVRQESFEELERTLLELQAEYQRAAEFDDVPRATRCRQAVIQAKEHARWAARKAENLDRKQEMALWMLTWLENPAVFSQWLELRKKELRAAGSALSTEFRSTRP